MFDFEDEPLYRRFDEVIPQMPYGHSESYGFTDTYGWGQTELQKALYGLTEEARQHIPRFTYVKCKICWSYLSIAKKDRTAYAGRKQVFKNEMFCISCGAVHSCKTGYLKTVFRKYIK